MQDGGRVVGHPAHEEKHDHNHRDLGGAGLFLVQEERRVADAVTECRDDLGGGRARRRSPEEEGGKEREAWVNGFIFFSLWRRLLMCS